MSESVASNSATAVMSGRPRVTKRRIAVGLLIAAIGLPSIVWAPAFDLLVLAIGLACLYELNALCEIKGQELEYPIAVLGVFAYIVLASLGRLQKWEGVLLAGVTIAAFSIGMYGDQRGYFARTAYTLLAVFTFSPQTLNISSAGFSSASDILREGAAIPTQSPGFK